MYFKSNITNKYCVVLLEQDDSFVVKYPFEYEEDSTFSISKKQWAVEWEPTTLSCSSSIIAIIISARKAERYKMIADPRPWCRSKNDKINANNAEQELLLKVMENVL
jgi:hypothetical protein